MTRASRHRLLLATLLILGVWIGAWATGLTGRFTADNIRTLLPGHGLWRLAAFVMLFSTGQLLRVPSPVFIAAAVAVYGLTVGVVVGISGALVSATVTFSVVRALAGQTLTDVQLPLLRQLLLVID